MDTCVTSNVDEIQLLQRFISALQTDEEVLKKEITEIPKISIVMPSYNQSEFIERSILSILNHKYPNLELIIIDGGSNDGSIDVIKKYEKYLAYWVSESDSGQSDALNKGFEQATGDIFGWLNSDDLYMPGALECAVETFSKYSNKSIVYGDWLCIDEFDRVIAREYAFDFSLGQLKYEGFHLNAQAMFWRKEVHKRFDGFDIHLHRTMDYQMILAFGINEGNDAFLRIPNIMGCFRKHASQKTTGFDNTVIKEHRIIASRYNFEDKYKRIGYGKRLIYRFRRAFWYVKRGGVVYFLKQLIFGRQ